jgi:hypothetical protein
VLHYKLLLLPEPTIKIERGSKPSKPGLEYPKPTLLAFFISLSIKIILAKAGQAWKKATKDSRPVT